MNSRPPLPDNEALAALIDVIKTVDCQLRKVARDLDERECALAELRVDALRRVIRKYAISPLGIEESEGGEEDESCK